MSELVKSRFPADPPGGAPNSLAQALHTLADWVEWLPRPAVACVIVRVVGSAPQSPGARMWVTQDRFRGTLGGGEFERRVLEDARRMLNAPADNSAPRGQAGPSIKEYALCRQMGQCCGGRVEVFFEPVPCRRAAHLFGGGHVGRALAQILSGMPFDVVLVDPRPEWGAGEGLPGDIRVRRMDPLEYARSRAWSADDAACIFTHSHDLDFLLIRHFLEQPVGYLGLIGSGHKADVFRARLAGDPRDGGSLQGIWDAKVRCPMGIPLPSKNPKVIAVSIAGELLRDWFVPAAAPAPHICTDGRSASPTPDMAVMDESRAG